MFPFREHFPKRTCLSTYANYRQFKAELAADFSNRCGYTNCHDFWFGGQDNFHIDHFVPWKKYLTINPGLKTAYSNLVYSCSYVNILKSDDEGQYLDPCQEDFNEHFTRDQHGMIVANPQSSKAVYMHKRLKLYLRRYQIIWMLDKLNSLIDNLLLLKDAGKTPEEKAEVNEMIVEVVSIYQNYKKYLRAV